MRGRGERQMAFAAEKARRRVEPDPAGAGHVDFRPGMQVGKVLARALRALDRIDVGLELDQIAGNETRREAEMAQRPAPAARRSRGTNRRRAPGVSSGVCTPGSMRMT